jgi:hypothetical protein
MGVMMADGPGTDSSAAATSDPTSETSNPDVSAQKPNQDIELTRLQQRKLALEIEDLTRPVWKRTSFYTALFPILAATLAVGTGIYTGYFDAAKERIADESVKNSYESEKLKDDNLKLDVRQKELSSENEKLDDRGKLLSAGIVALDEQKKGLSVEITKYEGDIADLTKANAELVRQKASLDANLHDLEAQKDALAQEVKELNEQRDQAEITQLTYQMDDITTRDGAYSKLDDLLRNDPNRYSHMLDDAGHDPDPSRGALLLLYRYKHQDDPHAMIELVSLIKGVPTDVDQHFWNVLEFARWSVDDLPPLWEVLIDRARRDQYGPDKLSNIFGLFDFAMARPWTPKKLPQEFVINYFKDRSNFLFGYKIIVKMVNDRGSFYSTNALAALVWLEPRAYLVFTAKLLSDGSVDTDLGAEVRKGLIEHAGHIRDIMRQMAFPNDEGQYKTWLTENADLVSFWTDPNLTLAQQFYPSRVR